MKKNKGGLLKNSTINTHCRQKTGEQEFISEIIAGTDFLK